MITMTSATTQSAATTDNSARHLQVKRAAEQFEAIMLHEVLKPLGQGSAIGGDNDADSGNAMSGYGVEAVAGALAKSGALGFARQLTAAVERRVPQKMSIESGVGASLANTSRDFSANL